MSTTVGVPRAIPIENLREHLLSAVLAYGDHAYDPALGLLREWAEPNPIHTRIGNAHAHRYVPSGYYALALLEAGRIGDAEAVLTALATGQDADTTSPTYGLWGYFAEEPVARMVPPDWNQADFNGRTLAMALLRHGDRLSGDVAAAARSAVGHAAVSIRRREVHLDYTNIAVKGTYVTAAAGLLLEDADMTAYAADRLRRLAARIDRTGTFAEFASPTYWLVAAEGLQAMAELGLPDGGLLARVQHRHWEHLAVRWNAGIGQIAGPMSRAYADDVTHLPALAAYLALALAEAAGGPMPGHEQVTLPEVSTPLVWPVLLHPRVPEDLLGHFAPGARHQREPGRQQPSHHQHRELVVLRDPDTAREQAGSSALDEQVATSWLTPNFTLGSINQSDTWLQRRVLLGQWVCGGAAGSSRSSRSSRSSTVRLRVLRDGEDVAAGSFSSVQERDRVLWAVGLALPGGDRHIHLDMLPAGELIPGDRLSAVFEVNAADSRWFAGEESLHDGDAVPPGEVVQVVADSVVIEIGVAAMSMGGRVVRSGDRLEVVLRAGDGGLDVTGPLAAVGTLRMRERVRGDADEVRGAIATERADPIEVSWAPTTVTSRWPGSGDERELSLTARSVVGTRAEHAEAFRSTIAGVPAPAPHLSDDLLVRDDATSERTGNTTSTRATRIGAIDSQEDGS
ncbi:hypothetical protein IM660_04740 [Ruania alkalisoli]|uniref:Heparinase II/III-like protein n=1 Tax=Ruania alkalisoli TaxID=2779775 RepID=A0A7M1SVV6_9MICO|nr:hypothetical protein [Ruania alkalisoli]QOR71601.1 hypothetical protein IM660_04740 [Ruania alkalisoli]